MVLLYRYNFLDIVASYIFLNFKVALKFKNVKMYARLDSLHASIEEGHAGEQVL
jgi:hypothetical protein